MRDRFGLDATRHQCTGAVYRGVDEYPLIGQERARAAVRQLRGIDPHSRYGETFGAWPILDQAFDQQAADIFLETDAGVRLDAAGHQGVASPFAPDDRRIAGKRRADLDAVDAGAVAGARHRALDADLFQLGCLNPRCEQLAVGTVERADLDLLPRCQRRAGQPGIGAEHDGLAHDVDQLAPRADVGNRPFQRMEDGDVPGFQAAW